MVFTGATNGRTMSAQFDVGEFKLLWALLYLASMEPFPVDGSGTATLTPMLSKILAENGMTVVPVDVWAVIRGMLIVISPIAADIRGCTHDVPAAADGGYLN